MMRGPLLPRRRHRREPERARRRRALAGARGAAGDAGGGDRGDPAALAGRLPDRTTAALHGRARADLHAARRAAADRGRGRAADGAPSSPAARRRPDRDRAGRGAVEAFERAGGDGKPRYGQLPSAGPRPRSRRVETAHEVWPNAAMGGRSARSCRSRRTSRPSAELVTEEQSPSRSSAAPTPERHLEAIASTSEAGFTHVYVHQVGPDQEGFIRFYADEILPKL